MSLSRFALVASLVLVGAPAAQTPSPSVGTGTLDAAFEALKKYDWGSPREALAAIDEASKACASDLGARADLERRLAAALRAECSRAARDFACRALGLIGGPDSVPALAPLLQDKELQEIARYALERIPCPEAAAVLRQSLSSLTGRAKVGIINSLGARRDAESAGALIGLLADPEPATAEAAAAALGSIGTDGAAKALAAIPGTAAAPLRAAASHALLACAERLARGGKRAEATEIYRSLSSVDQAKHIKAAAQLGLAATSGAKEAKDPAAGGGANPAAPSASSEILRLESDAMLVEIDPKGGAWSLLDKAAGVRWPSDGRARPGTARGLTEPFEVKAASAGEARLAAKDGAAVSFALADGGRALEIRYEGKDLGEIRALDDALAVTGAEDGAVIVPCREGLLIPANGGGPAFRQSFGTSEYEGCHMNMLGLLKKGAALAVTWDGAYVWAEIQGAAAEGQDGSRRIAPSLLLRGPARSFQIAPLGPGGWNTLAAGYRRIAEQKKLAATIRDTVSRNRRAELMLGAANVKLWTCLARRMNEESTKEESVKVRWTFDEAARIAEHLRNDLGIARCLFIMGGWTEGGYDVRHPDNLPANPECGGNDGLAAAIRRIQALGYLPCLHDNYQDMYRDAKSWDPACIEKRADGSLIQGGRWLGGRAYMVCAPKQLELAMRPQNLPSIRTLFDPWCYFIDTTYAVGPRECADPNHPIGRDDDIAWKIKLSDHARGVFGLFGSECGREWALPHSDFFEGLTGVSGRYYHNLKPETLGALVIPFWEMVYHDCQICYGKYGYAADGSAEYVAHHVLCARPLHYHSIPDHLYWKDTSSKPDPEDEEPAAAPPGEARACFTRTDQGWARGLHPTDAFLKNTHEVLGPLHEATAFDRLMRLEFLTADRAVRRAVYGAGDGAVTVTVNFGAADSPVESRLGGTCILPAWGFVVEAPRFAAFYAKRWNGREYPSGALFTIRSLGDANLDRAPRVRIFHAFGDPAIVWRGSAREVKREETIDAGR